MLLFQDYTASKCYNNNRQWKQKRNGRRGLKQPKSFQAQILMAILCLSFFLLWNNLACSMLISLQDKALNFRLKLMTKVGICDLLEPAPDTHTLCSPLLHSPHLIHPPTHRFSFLHWLCFKKFNSIKFNQYFIR